MMAEMLAGPLERVFSALSGRGNVTVIFHLLGAEASRFSELERAMPGISQRRLVKCLRELEAMASYIESFTTRYRVGLSIV
jgi:DNA-binding HxlR family transcriptional regulator